MDAPLSPAMDTFTDSASEEVDAFVGTNWPGPDFSLGPYNATVALPAFDLSSLSDFFEPTDAIPASFAGPIVLELELPSLTRPFEFSCSSIFARSFGRITRGTEALLEFFRCCHHSPFDFAGAESAVFGDEPVSSSDSNCSSRSRYLRPGASQSSSSWSRAGLPKKLLNRCRMVRGWHPEVTTKQKPARAVAVERKLTSDRIFMARRPDDRKQRYEIG